MNDFLFKYKLRVSSSVCEAKDRGEVGIPKVNMAPRLRDAPCVLRQKATSTSSAVS